MSSIFYTTLLFLSGILDSVRLDRIISAFNYSRHIRQNYLNILTINPLILLFSILTEFGILPHYRWLYVLGIIWCQINLFLDGVYHDQILYRILSLKRPENVKHRLDIYENLTEQIFRVLFISLFTLYCNILHNIPYLGTLLYITHTSILHSMYCFEHRLFDAGFTVKQQLDLMEYYFFYFLGFGFIYAVVNIYLPYLLSMYLMSCIYPLCLMLTFTAKPVRKIYQWRQPRVPLLNTVWGLYQRILDTSFKLLQR